MREMRAKGTERNNESARKKSGGIGFGLSQLEFLFSTTRLLMKQFQAQQGVSSSQGKPWPARLPV